MKRVALLSLLVAATGLGGCASNTIHFPEWFKQTDMDQTTQVNVMSETADAQSNLPDNGLVYRPDHRDHARMPQNATTERRWNTPQSLYAPRFTHKGLEDYAEQIAMALFEQTQGSQVGGKVAIASFVHLDRTLKRRSIIGNQLSELLIAEIQAYGISVVDFKVRDDITVTASGDLVMTRKRGQLSDADYDYILVGTMIENGRGMKINARLMRQDDKSIVASATTRIPHFVVESLFPDVITL